MSMDIDSEETKYDVTISNDDDIETVEKKQNENEKRKKEILCEGGTKTEIKGEADHFITKKEISYLLFDNHNMDDNAMEVISNTLSNSKHVTKTFKCISFQNNKFGSKGASSLFEATHHFGLKIQQLNLSGNKIDDECMKPLGLCLQINTMMKELNLRANKITDTGLETLPQYLVDNYVLETLNLSLNRGITDASTPYLISVAEKSCIECIWLNETCISIEKYNEIDEAIDIRLDEVADTYKSGIKTS